MSRPPARSERAAAAAATKGRPKRRAAKTHFFKYQLANNPSRAEENDLKRALQESMEEQFGLKKRGNNNNNSSNNVNIISSTNSSDVSRSNNSSFSNESAGSFVIKAMALKRTRSSATPPTSTPSNTPPNKRARLIAAATNGHQNANTNTNCFSGVSSKNTSTTTTTTTTITNKPPSPIPHVDKAIKTYSRIKHKSDGHQLKQQQRQFTEEATTTRTSNNNVNNNNLTNNRPTAGSVSISMNQDKETKLKGSIQSGLSKSTQTPSVSRSSSGSKSSLTSTTKNINHSNNIKTPISANMDNGNLVTREVVTLAPVQDQYLKFRRESKNYAYAKMTALKVSTSKSPSSNSTTKSNNSKKASPNGNSHHSIGGVNKDSSKIISPKAAAVAHNNSNQNGATNNLASNQSSSTKVVCNGPSKILTKTGSKSDNKLEPNKPVASSGKKSPSSTNSNSTKSTNLNGKAPQQQQQNSNIHNKLPATTSVQTSQQMGKNSIPRHDIHIDVDIDIDDEGPKNDCSLDVDDYNTIDLSKKKNQNQANVKVTKKRLPPGSWSLLGVPEEKVVYLRDDEPPKRLICYPAIKHVEGDVIQVRDSVLLRSGARKTDLPYIAKVCAFWEDAETGGVMMSLFWYYRPEHTEEGRKPHHLIDEIFASRHRDVDSVECIEDKCYVLTFNEYCRYRKRCKMEQVNTTWSLTDVTIPVSNESYPRRNRIPDSDINPELVFCCRQIYDSRMKRLIKNPLINPKYGHI